MLCSKYLDLSIPERTTLIGELVHSLQSDNETFEALRDIVKDAKEKGIFDKVTFEGAIPFVPVNDVVIDKKETSY